MLDLMKLRYMVAVADHLSYARASEELGISQPALTRAIQVLERQLGMRLFDRDRSGVKLTVAGQAISAQAAVLLTNAADLAKEAELIAHGKTGRVVFGMTPMPARVLLSFALRDQLKKNPDVTNRIIVRNIEELWPLLAKGEIEFVVGLEGQLPDSPPIRAESLGHSPTTIVVRDGHPIFQEGRNGRRFPLVMASSRLVPLPSHLENLVHGVPHVVESIDALRQLTLASDAMWLTSVFGVAEELASGILRRIPSVETLHSPRMMVHSLERRTLSPGAQSVLQDLRRSMKRLRALALDCD